VETAFTFILYLSHKMLNEEYQVTFGVELECIFGFHESLLQQHLDRTDEDSRIIKDIPEDVRQEFRQGPECYRQTRPSYIGWALTGPTAFPSARDDHQGLGFYESARQELGYRPYGDEILQLAQGVLGPNVDVHNAREKRQDFNRWHLTVDTSLVGATKEELQSNLGDRIADSVDNWDSSGLELVSRILPPIEESFDEISRYLDLLKGSSESRHGAFTNEYCALHVHVGLPPSGDANEPAPVFDLPTLQHLAYILVMYEAEITKLHPWSTRGPYSTAALTDCKPNLDTFYADSEAAYIAREAAAAAAEEEASANSETSRSTPDIPNIDSLSLNHPFSPVDWANGASPTYPNTSENNKDDEEPTHETILDPFTHQPILIPIDGPSHLSLHRARHRIFAPTTTLPTLVATMSAGVRERIVNWTYLLRTGAGEARTVEFRQHEGCLDSEGVRSWVRFCVGLVRVANFMAGRYGAREGYAGEGYPWRWIRGEMGVEDLVGMMGWGGEGEEWLRGRVGACGR